MRYLPKSQSDRETMLGDIGVKSVDDLFAAIPAEYRLTRDLNIPRSYAESEIVEFFRDRAAENGQGFATFLGAGAYSHYRPVVIDALVSRGEFFTAYTPYQPEIAQGTLQAIFEFQSMICELTGMDVANASMYDGSTGAAEGLMMAVRVTGRSSLPFYLRFYMGGEQQIRGYNIRAVGPREPSSNALVGGDKFALFNAEYYFDVMGPVRALLFFDAGQAYLKGQRITPGSFVISTGAELRFIMPVLNVPFRLIYAINPNNNPLIAPRHTFKFAVGTTF